MKMMMGKPDLNRNTHFPVKIVMVWSMVLIGIIIYSIVWFSMGAVVMSYIDAIDSSFDFGARWNNIVTLTKNIVYWHPILAFFGWIFWGYLNSQRRNIRQWEQ